MELQMRQDVSWISQRFSVTSALIIRDLMGRFGRSSLGFIWTFLEPMILCVGVMITSSQFHEPLVHGIPLVGFVMSGYMPLTMWRHLTSPMTRLLSMNQDLLNHQPISYADVLIAKIALEFLSTTAALLVIVFFLLSFGLIEPFDNLGLCLLGWLFAGWLSAAAGINICALTERYQVAEKFIAPYNYLTLPISGFLIMIDWLPGRIQWYAGINPQIHFFELFRAGMFGDATPTHYDILYLTAWCVGLTLLGVHQINRVHEHVGKH